MSTRVLLCVIMYTLADCTPRPPSTSTTLRLTAQRNDTGTWTAKFGDYQMVIEHKHFNKNPVQEDQDGTWTLKVRHTSTVYDVKDEEDADRQMVMDILQHYNNTATTMQPVDNEYAQVEQLSSNNENNPFEQLSSNNEDGQAYQLSSNNEYAQFGQSPSNPEDEEVDQLPVSSVKEYGQLNQESNDDEDGQHDQLSSDNEYGQDIQLFSNNDVENDTSVEEESVVKQMTSEEREHYLVEQERKLIMERFPRSRSLGYDVREFDLESKGYRYYPEVGWVKLNTAHWQWDQARKSCEADGGHLAIPDTLLKISTFKRILKNNVDIIERAVLKNQVFVGVYIPYSDRRFMTVRGEPFTPESVSIWFPNEPNDADPGEDCVTMHLEGKLRDVPCFYNLPFLCQIH